MELKNAKSWPEVYSCRFIEPGLISYKDIDGGTVLLRKQTIDKMLSSFVGRPVCSPHQKITPENYGELRAKGLIFGNVINTRFNPEDGWYWADFIVDTEEGNKKASDARFNVSCAYNVLDLAEGGLWHDIEYDGEIIDGSFTHLALVESPRYEDAKITKEPVMLVNGKEENLMSIFKLFGKKAERTNPEDFATKHIAIENKAIPLSDYLLSCFNGKALDLGKYSAVNAKQDYMAQDDDIIDINGITVSIAELKAAYLMKMENEKKMNEKSDDDDEEKKKKKKDEEAKNAKDEEDKKKAKEEEEKKNATAAEEKEKAEKDKKAKETEEKKNAKERADAFFTELSNAGKQSDPVESTSREVMPRTRQERADAFKAKTTKK